MRLDAGSRLVLARDQIDRLRAEADAERLAKAARSRAGREGVGGWEGRPVGRPVGDRVLALLRRNGRRDPRLSPE